jgi:hypothetical protein
MRRALPPKLPIDMKQASNLNKKLMIDSFGLYKAARYSILQSEAPRLNWLFNPNLERKPSTIHMNIFFDPISYGPQSSRIDPSEYVRNTFSINFQIMTAFINGIVLPQAHNVDKDFYLLDRWIGQIFVFNRDDKKPFFTSYRFSARRKDFEQVRQYGDVDFLSDYYYPLYPASFIIPEGDDREKRLYNFLRYVLLADWPDTNEMMIQGQMGGSGFDDLLGDVDVDDKKYFKIVFSWTFTGRPLYQTRDLYYGDTPSVRNQDEIVNKIRDFGIRTKSWFTPRKLNELLASFYGEHEVGGGLEGLIGGSIPQDNKCCPRNSREPETCPNCGEYFVNCRCAINRFTNSSDCFIEYQNRSIFCFNLLKNI